MMENPVYYKKKPKFDREMYEKKVIEQFAYAADIKKGREFVLQDLMDILDEEQLQKVYDQVVGDD